MAGDDTIITNTTPTSTNKIIPFNIPIKLSLEKHNYTSWCSFLKIHLGNLGLKTHIEGSSTSSNDPEWDKQDDLVKVWILGTLEESLQDQVVATPGNAKALWDHIKDLFHDNKDARAITLDDELRSIKLGSLSINAYCTKIKAMADRLANLGEKVSDKNLVMYALNGLDTRYKGIARLIRHIQPLPKFETACNMLLLEESNLQEAIDQAITYDSSSSSPTVLMATKMDTKEIGPAWQPKEILSDHKPGTHTTPIPFPGHLQASPLPPTQAHNQAQSYPQAHYVQPLYAAPQSNLNSGLLGPAPGKLFACRKF
ncbi:hybrid signal transduction histidine kinase M [Artemisia annua]|uniref:Hybrid signal transduction histidine kinase M n=1 Tax=Artemisia annua TaxID=35608 RepID=A0A2U1KLU7_ARTAN|nr:hybrid signal transduction histidine kinase M [Artemisia annua]